MKHITLSLIGFLLTTGLSLAQSSKLDKAELLFNAGKPEKAYSLLEKVWSKTNSAEAGYKLAELYYRAGFPRKADDWGNRSGLTTDTALSSVLLWTDILILEGAYRRALDHCLDYALNHPEQQEIRRRAYAYEQLMMAAEGHAQYELISPPFNTSAEEISITGYRRHFVISSNRSGALNELSVSDPAFDFYLLQQDYGKWRYPVTLLKATDSDHNRTTLCYSADGNRVFFTLSDRLSAKERSRYPDSLPGFRIYSAWSMGNHWEEVAALPFQKPGVRYKDPAYLSESQTLVFSSDADGDFDLYASTFAEGRWSVPQPLGSSVNSNADENMPWFGADDYLYFSSDRSDGFGGFDIYRTRLDKGIWLRAEILAPPVNSIHNDLSYMQGPGGQTGYFVSDRNGGFDIYGFRVKKAVLGVSVVNAHDGSLLAEAEVSVTPQNGRRAERMTGSDGVARFDARPGTTCRVEVVKEGYLTASHELTLRTADKDSLVYLNIRLERDPDYSEDNADSEATRSLFFPAEFIFIDSEGLPLPDLAVRLINNAAKKMKIYTTDSDGRFKQSLFYGHSYRLVFPESEAEPERAIRTAEGGTGEALIYRFTLTNP